MKLALIGGGRVRSPLFVASPLLRAARAGLVAQALRDAGFSRTIGICDGANVGHQAVADWLKLDQHKLRAEVFGLNHLSWTRRVLLGDNDVLAPLLRDPAFLSGTMMKLF